MGDLAKEGHHEIRKQVHIKAMKYRVQQHLIHGLLAASLLFCCTRPALGIILHPDGEPNLATWTDRPDPNVAGRWGNNASCVAVSSNCVIMTRHQGGGIGTVVEIGGGTYTVADIWTYSTADLRVAKLYGANLRSFVGLHEDTNEIGKDIVIGGYGDGRGGLLKTGGITYGYEWDNSTNTTLRLGTNKVDNTENDNTIGSLTSDIIIADFDGLNEGESTIYEGIPAVHDSGSGWFIKVGETWKVAGLSRAVGTHYEEGHPDDANYILYEAWFRSRADPDILQPDYLDAVRISSYATWILETIPERLPGDLTGDDWVDLADFAVFAQYWQNTECEFPDWCAGADCEPDGDVDWADLAALVDGWLCDWDCY
jgi:hypothetical protein